MLTIPQRQKSGGGGGGRGGRGGYQDNDRGGYSNQGPPSGTNSQPPAASTDEADPYAQCKKSRLPRLLCSRLTTCSCRRRLPELCCSLVSVIDVPTATGRWARSAVRRPSSRRPVMHVHDLMIFDYSHDYDGCRQHFFEESLPFRYLLSILCPLCIYRTPLD